MLRGCVSFEFMVIEFNCSYLYCQHFVGLFTYWDKRSLSLYYYDNDTNDKVDLNETKTKEELCDKENEKTYTHKSIKYFI